MNVFFNFVLKKSILGLTLLLFIIGFFVAQIPNFQLDASSDSLILEGDKNLAFYQNVKKNYGSDDYLVISYQVTGELLNPQQLSHLSKFKKELLAIEQVKSVTSILDVPLFRSPPVSLAALANETIAIENGNANLELAAREFKTSPLYANNLVSKDGKTTAILVTLKDNPRFQELRETRDQMRVERINNALNKDGLSKLKSIERQVMRNASIQGDIQGKTIAQIRTYLVKYSDQASLFLGGLPMITTDIIGYISSDLIVFSLAVIGLMTIILAKIIVINPITAKLKTIKSLLI